MIFRNDWSLDKRLRILGEANPQKVTVNHDPQQRDLDYKRLVNQRDRVNATLSSLCSDLRVTLVDERGLYTLALRLPTWRQDFFNCNDRQILDAVLSHEADRGA